VLFDELDSVQLDYLDPILCPLFSAASGSYGPVSVNAQGDVSGPAGVYWDCPPFDPDGPSGGPSVTVLFETSRLV
jgi:hypothetical protein